MSNNNEQNPSKSGTPEQDKPANAPETPATQPVEKPTKPVEVQPVEPATKS